jgi:hypothetical protein
MTSRDGSLKLWNSEAAGVTASTSPTGADRAPFVFIAIHRCYPLKSSIVEL